MAWSLTASLLKFFEPQQLFAGEIVQKLAQKQIRNYFNTMAHVLGLLVGGPPRSASVAAPAVCPPAGLSAVPPSAPVPPSFPPSKCCPSSAPAMASSISSYSVNSYSGSPIPCFMSFYRYDSVFIAAKCLFLRMVVSPFSRAASISAFDRPGMRPSRISATARLATLPLDRYCFYLLLAKRRSSPRGRM